MERLYAALALLETTALEVMPVDRELALMAAHIKAEHVIAYADAFAAALAEQRAATVVTDDPEFKPLERVLDIRWLPQREPQRTSPPAISHCSRTALVPRVHKFSGS